MTNKLLSDIVQLVPIEIILSIIHWYHYRFIVTSQYIDHNYTRIVKQINALFIEEYPAIMSYNRCPTTYQIRLFFNNFTTNEDIATKFEADLPQCVRNVTTS